MSDFVETKKPEQPEQLNTMLGCCTDNYMVVTDYIVLDGNQWISSNINRTIG